MQTALLITPSSNVLTHILPDLRFLSMGKVTFLGFCFITFGFLTILIKGAQYIQHQASSIFLVYCQNHWNQSKSDIYISFPGVYYIISTAILGILQLSRAILIISVIFVVPPLLWEHQSVLIGPFTVTSDFFSWIINWCVEVLIFWKNTKVLDQKIESSENSFFNKFFSPLKKITYFLPFMGKKPFGGDNSTPILPWVGGGPPPSVFSLIKEKVFSVNNAGEPKSLVDQALSILNPSSPPPLELPTHNRVGNIKKLVSAIGRGLRSKPAKFILNITVRLLLTGAAIGVKSLLKRNNGMEISNLDENVVEEALLPQSPTHTRERSLRI